jgi:hypothetical protein
LSEGCDDVLFGDIQLIKNLKGKLPRFSSSPQTILYPVRKPRYLQRG